MNTGCPTLVSDIPVFREILKDKTYFFSPNSHEDCIFNMEKILFDNENKKNLIYLGNIISQKIYIYIYTFTYLYIYLYIYIPCWQG